MLEYRRTLQKYENEASMPAYVASLATDLAAKHTETVSKVHRVTIMRGYMLLLLEGICYC